MMASAQSAGSQPAGLQPARRDLATAFKRGAIGRCPSCGKGNMFRAFLKVADTCNFCGEELHHQRADDAPAYFVIMIVGHIIVPILFAVEMAFTPALWLHAIIFIPATVALSLIFLPLVKGSIVAWQWAQGMHGFHRAIEATPLAHSAHLSTSDR